MVLRRKKRRGSALHKTLWVIGGILIVLALAAVVAIVVIDESAPGPPGPFYAAPDPLPDAKPGTILRREETESLTPNSSAHKVLYLSTGIDGKPAAVSGVIYVPEGPAPKSGRKIVALNHGTTGVRDNCAPSMITDPEKTPAWDFGAAGMLEKGWIVAATDYQGLGTAGPHPYIVGRPAATDALDIVRAARNLPNAEATDIYAVWGHSQGGHASMFTGQFAKRYAPELKLAGVAAAAPVPSLKDAIRTGTRTAVGRVMVSYALWSWEQVFGAPLSRLVKPGDRGLVNSAASHCLSTINYLAAVPPAILLGKNFLTADPWRVEPWQGIMERNTPGKSAVPAPLLLLNGTADKLVDPDLTRGLARRMCGYGRPVAFRLVPGAEHGPTGHDAAPQVTEWLANRFAGRPAPDGCARLTTEKPNSS